MAGIYGIGVSALKAAQAGIAATTHNIANANTPGYSRQEIMQTAEMPQNTGAGYFGQGANVTSVLRRYDQFLGVQVLEAQTQTSNLTAQFDLAQQVSNLFGDANGGLTPALQDFFSSVNTVSNAPESIAARQTMIGSAQSLVNRLDTFDQRLGQIRESLNGRMTNSVSLINSYAKQIAALNVNIVELQAKTPGQVPNDLLDQRDLLISQLSQEIRVTTVSQPEGSVDVFIGNGQSLVVGRTVSSLHTVTSSTDPTALDVAYLNNGNSAKIQQSQLQGGNLGAYLDFRQNILDPAVNSLGRIAIGLAETFNQQHQQGIDLKGALGSAFFASAAPRTTSASSNLGTGALTATISAASALTASDYSVQFDGTNYKIFDTTSNALVGAFTEAELTAGQVVTGTGITLQLTGSASIGDSFLVRPTADAAKGMALNITDPSKIAAGSPIRSNAPITNMGSGVIGAATVDTTVVPLLPLDVNLQNSVTVTFIDATHFNVDDATQGPLAVNTVYDPAVGATLSFNGWTAKLTGAPSANDTFTIQNNINASSDGTNVLKLAELQTANTMVNGTTSYQGAYGQLISQVGTQTRELDVTSKAQSSMLAQVTKAQQSTSGVNLDEEAANLLKYQQAYQAAAKAMAISQSMFDSLLQLGG
ncbi:MAG: flagellar hook-associated protein FlgK [Sideroxydans sp.]|jgi:flagellar hook-associated protein 1 FlgK